jgi:hypothetical protein
MKNKKNFMKYCALILSLITTLVISPLSAKAFHILYMGDDGDKYVGQSVNIDLKNIHKSFTYIASACGMPLYMKTLRSPELRQANIEAWIKKAAIAEDDVVILYYSGHGGRSRNSPTIWPVGSVCEKYKVDFTLIIEKLLSKRAALSVVLLDCCNTFGFKPKQVQVRRAFNLNLESYDPKLVAAGCKQLFFKTKGLIISSGSAPGKVSEILIPNQGGYFTSYFLERLLKESQKPDPQWRRIFEKTKTKVLYETKNCPFTKTQKLQYKMLLTPDVKSPSVYRKFLYENSKYTKAKTFDLDEEVRCFCGAHIHKAEEDSGLLMVENNDFEATIADPVTIIEIGAN